MPIEDYRLRQRTEEREELLSPFAMKSKNSRGRMIPEDDDPIRTCFQKDRDRILHSNAFRRLKHKTQVFVMPLGDHYVTRLTHTLEVSQIARTISRGLNLNEDLTEAIALGHDLGHTPFGHFGERLLAKLYKEGFRHNEQSLRVVDVIEKNGQGLNLTYEVRNGILHHSKSDLSLFDDQYGKNSTFEADVVKISDAVAYINHDIKDAIRAGLLSEEDLPDISKKVLGTTHAQRINTMVSDIIMNSWAVTGEIEGEPMIRMSNEINNASDTLRKFMFENVYNADMDQKSPVDAEKIITLLYEYFTAHPEKMPADYYKGQENVARCVVDYISGMSDNYALSTARSIDPTIG